MGSGVNLIPAPIRARRQERRRVGQGLIATAIYLSLLFVATTGYLALNAPRSADAAAAELAVDTERVAVLRKQVVTLKQNLIEADRQLAGGRVLSERPDWSTLLRLVALAAGDEVVLNDFALGTTGPTIEAGASVTLGGIATDPWTVSSFALRLEETGLFDEVKIESSRREPFGDRTATAFTLRCELHEAEPTKEGS
ncbi:MAG: PilN domain-containing protein [Planctomycetota bacterium]